jgi:hypothetical protein
MIAAAAWPRFLAGRFAPLDLTADASLALGAEARTRPQAEDPGKE